MKSVAHVSNKTDKSNHPPAGTQQTAPDPAIPRLDRSQFKRQTFREADLQLEFWLTKSPVERLAAAAWLNSVAWDFDIQNPPR